MLAFLWPGDTFGYLAVLGRTNQVYSLQMTEEGRVLMCSSRVIIQMLRRSPVLAANAFRLIATRFEWNWRRLQDLATEPVEQRVARALLHLAGPKNRRLALLHQDLAEYVGTTPPTLSRILRRWKTRGLVDANRSRILIRHPGELTLIADDP